MAEIEAIARIEPIGGLVGVSEPPPPAPERPRTPRQAEAQFRRIARLLGAEPAPGPRPGKKKRKPKRRKRKG